ncbi:hypothetical protein QFC21_005909 [Naganishia friedmannii]|uniref:Uncharacterized protein n=1 Tax=Naganishia friedmannii TaxID=89922 RepID=A0ACC2V7X7_9TREE|nr:hypothetical protein QFC21_005909 [Naganishia friedmannii]
MGRGKIKKIKPVSLQARKAAIAQQQQLQAQKAALERQIAEERSKQARLQREIEEKERLVRGLERVGASAEEAYSYPPPWNTSYSQDYQQQQQLLQQQAQHSDSIAPISDKALSMLNHMLGNRGLMQRDPTTGTIDVVLSQETMANAASSSSHPGNTAGMTTYDPSSLLAGMQGIFAGDMGHVGDEGMLEEGGETNAETREALAEAMAAMKAAAHVAKALPLMMLNSAAQSMSHHSATGQWTTPISSSPYSNHPNAIAEAHMVLDPRMMDEHLHGFRAMLEDPEERMRLGVGFEMLGWAVGDPNTAVPDIRGQGHGYTSVGDGAGRWDGQTGGARTAQTSEPVPTLEDMLKLPIFNNEAFRSSPLFGKHVSSPNSHAHHSTSGDLYLESTDLQGSTPMDMHNLDLMQDFLSSASGMLNGPIFGGVSGGNRNERSAPQASTGTTGSTHPPPPSQTQTQTRPRHPPPQTGVPTNVAEYPSGEMTASEAVRAVTELLEASSRKLQNVTGEHGREGGDAEPGVNVDVRFDERQQQREAQDVHSSVPAGPVAADSSSIPLAAANAILRARASSSRTAVDETEHSDIDAISVESDPNLFPEDEFPDDDNGGYYSDEDYEEEEYDEDGERIAYTTDEDAEVGSSHYSSSEGREGETYYDSEDGEEYESPEQLAELARRREAAGIPLHPARNTTSTSIPSAQQQRTSGTPTPTAHAALTQQHKPISGQQMLEILKRMSPEARQNYQAALVREKMEYERRIQQGGAAPQLLSTPTQPHSRTPYQHTPIQPQQAPNTARPPPPTQEKVPSDQAVNELFSWIKAVIWTIEQHAIRAARAQMEAKGVTVATDADDAKSIDRSAESGKSRATAATWTPKATPDGAKMRAMMRTVGIDVAPA